MIDDEFVDSHLVQIVFVLGDKQIFP